jgi:NTP pyrophosphatase (non-canonical NTP hydrolase)
MDEVSLDRYNTFVDTLLSTPSKNLDVLAERLFELQRTTNANWPRLLTGGAGLSSEAGELQEIVKKIVFQGKAFNEDVHFHMVRELGDIIFYWMVTCQALGVSGDDIIKENIRKLEARYPGGKFDVTHSEVRKQGDL